MRILPLALFVLASVAAADTYPRQPGIDAVHYDFSLTLSDDTDDVVGQAKVQIRFLESGLREFALDLGANMAVQGYQHQADRLLIPVDPPSKAGELRTFTIRYHGKPKSGLRIGKNKYGERGFYSENWPDNARQWLPMIDHPYDKATSEFRITAPAYYQVVANGLLQEETDLTDGRRLTHWKQSVPISSWLNAIGVGRQAVRHFGTVKGIPLETWVFHQDRDAGIPTFEKPARDAMEFFIDHIGPFSYEKLANVEAAGLNGGTEHASAIFYGEKSVNGQPATRLVAHEIAHQWFGDAVTEKDWDDVWLSEGFATYFTLLAAEHYEGRDSFVAELQKSRESVFTLESKLPGEAVLHNNLSDMKKVLNRIIYQKGGWTLHMLRTLVGDDEFWAGIREYYATYRNQNTTTDEFRTLMERHAGLPQGGLRWFFDQWLRRPGSPVVEGTWAYNAAAKKIEIDVTQTQPGEPYRLALQFATGGTIVQREMLGKQHHFEIETETPPTTVTLDPQTTLLAQIKFGRRL